MKGRLVLLVGSCTVALVTVATASIAVPHFVRIALGVLIVLILPGFAFVCAVLPEGQLSRGERLLASVGISLAMTTCAAVLLAAMPIGLSRQSLAIVLGGSTIMLSTCAGYRFRAIYFSRRNRVIVSKGIGN
jgi:uncharacterized membrane protein